MTEHHPNCEDATGAYPGSCTCKTIAMDNLIAQDADLIDKLRDEDSYYRLQEKHWCIDAEELERQRLAAADRIEALEAENERLRGVLRGVTPPAHFGESEQSKAWWAKARAALGEKQ